MSNADPSTDFALSETNNPENNNIYFTLTTFNGTYVDQLNYDNFIEFT